MEKVAETLSAEGSRDGRVRRWPGRRAVGWVLVTVGLALVMGRVQPMRGWDQTFYLGQTSSLVEDGDLDLRNDALFSTADPTILLRLLSEVEPHGALRNAFSIGPSLVWATAYLVALPLRALGWERPAVRWGWAERVALHLLSLGLALALIWGLDRWLGRLGAGPGLAFAGALALVMGTPLLVYAFRQYATSHLPSTLAVTGLIGAALLVGRRPTALSAFACGVALGLVFLCRWQDVLKGAVLLVPAWTLWREGHSARRLAALGAVAGGAALAVASLQLHVWGLERQALFSLPQGTGFMRWTEPEFGRFLFSGFSGLLPWSPVFAVGIVGLLLPWRCRLGRGWQVAALALLLVDVYVNAAVSDWWAGEGYGARRMSSDVPLVAIGLANLAAWRRLRGPLAAALVACCGWGLFTSNLYVRGVRDLNLVFAGRASVVPGAERDQDGQPPVAKAREIARTFPVRHRGLNFFRGRGLSRGWGRTATGAVLLLFLLPVAWGLERWGGARLVQGLLVAAFGLVLAAHLRLATGPEPEAAERRLWGSLAVASREVPPELGPLEPEIEQILASGEARLADPYRYLWGFARWREGRRVEARKLVEPLAEIYPAGGRLMDFLEGRRRKADGEGR